MIGAIFTMQSPTHPPFFKPGLKVLFPRDLKVTRYRPPLPPTLPFKRPRAPSPSGDGEKDTEKREKPGGIKNCTRHLVLPTRSAKSQTTQPPFRHHRGRVGDGSLQDDIKGGAKKRKTERSLSISTASCSNPQFQNCREFSLNSQLPGR